MSASQRAPSWNGGACRANEQDGETRGRSPEPSLQTTKTWGLSQQSHHPLKAWHLKLMHFPSKVCVYCITYLCIICTKIVNTWDISIVENCKTLTVNLKENVKEA